MLQYLWINTQFWLISEKAPLLLLRIHLARNIPRVKMYLKCQLTFASYQLKVRLKMTQKENLLMTMEKIQRLRLNRALMKVTDLDTMRIV